MEPQMLLNPVDVVVSERTGNRGWNAPRYYRRSDEAPVRIRNRGHPAERFGLRPADRKAVLPELSRDAACSNRLHLPGRSAEHRIVFPSELTSAAVAAAGAAHKTVRDTDGEPDTAAAEAGSGKAAQIQGTSGSLRPGLDKQFIGMMFATGQHNGNVRYGTDRTLMRDDVPAWISCGAAAVALATALRIPRTACCALTFSN